MFVKPKLKERHGHILLCWNVNFANSCVMSIKGNVIKLCVIEVPGNVMQAYVYNKYWYVCMAHSRLT